MWRQSRRSVNNSTIMCKHFYRNIVWRSNDERKYYEMRKQGMIVMKLLFCSPKSNFPSVKLNSATILVFRWHNCLWSFFFQRIYISCLSQFVACVASVSDRSMSPPPWVFVGHLSSRLIPWVGYLSLNFVVNVEGSTSHSKDLLCGVPQGFLLGPILYLLYTSPLDDIKRAHITYSISLLCRWLPAILLFQASRSGHFSTSDWILFEWDWCMDAYKHVKAE